MNYNNISFDELKIDESHLIDLFSLLEKKEITDTIGQKIMEKLVVNPFDVKEYVKKENVQVVSDTTELEKFCTEAIKEAPQAVEEYRSGKEQALNFIVGLVMKKTNGQADPPAVKKILIQLIGKK